AAEDGLRPRPVVAAVGRPAVPESARAFETRGHVARRREDERFGIRARRGEERAGASGNVEPRLDRLAAPLRVTCVPVRYGDRLAAACRHRNTATPAVLNGAAPVLETRRQ